MRRPVLYLAGLLLATGASLALAGPAQAAVSNGSAASAKTASSHDWCDDDYHHGHGHYHGHHGHYGHGHGYGHYSSYTSNHGILNGNSISVLDVF